MLILSNGYDFFQVFLTRLSYKKWGFAVVHSYQNNDQRPIQPLHSRFFVISHFKTRGRLFSNQGDMTRTLTIQRAIGLPIRARDEKAELNLIEVVVFYLD